MVTRIPYRLELRDLDGFRHLGHARAIELLEIVRTRAYNEPLGIRDLGGHDLIMVELNVRYHEQGLFGDDVVLAGRISGVGTTSLAFDYEIARASGETLVTARSYNVCFDHKANRSRPVPPLLRALGLPHPRSLPPLPTPASLTRSQEASAGDASRCEVLT